MSAKGIWHIWEIHDLCDADDHETCFYDKEYIADLEAKLAAAEAEITKLKAQLWVAKDSQLRTYDGLAQKADKYEAAEAVIAELECWSLPKEIADIIEAYRNKK